MSTHIDVSADGNQFDDSLLWTEPTWAAHPQTTIRVMDGNDLISLRAVASWPSSGSIGALPDVPEWVTPAPGTESHPLHQAIEWKLYEDAPYAQLWLQGVPSVGWIVVAAPKATTLTVPEPPSPVVLTDLFGGYLYGSVQTGWPVAGANYWEAYSSTKPIKMMIP